MVCTLADTNVCAYFRGLWTNGRGVFDFHNQLELSEYHKAWLLFCVRNSLRDLLRDAELTEIAPVPTYWGNLKIGSWKYLLLPDSWTAHSLVINVLIDLQNEYTDLQLYTSCPSGSRVWLVWLNLAWNWLILQGLRVAQAAMTERWP